MKKINSEAVVFQPSIQAHDVGESWAISFDSGSERDVKRESRTVFVLKRNIKTLDVQVEGFDQIEATETSSFITGRISLVATYRYDQTSQSSLLAESILSPWLQHGSLKSGDQVNDVAEAVRNGTADAFTTVLPALFAPKNRPALDVYEGERVVSRRETPPRRSHARTFGQRARESRLQQWRPWFVAGGVVVAVWILLSVISKPAQPSAATLAANTPDAQTLLQNQPPPQTGADAQAQVELVKSTLKSMGLEPGASGDTGCLVQPH